MLTFPLKAMEAVGSSSQNSNFFKPPSAIWFYHVRDAQCELKSRTWACCTMKKVHIFDRWSGAQEVSATSNILNYNILNYIKIRSPFVAYSHGARFSICNFKAKSFFHDPYNLYCNDDAIEVLDWANYSFSLAVGKSYGVHVYTVWNDCHLRNWIKQTIQEDIPDRILELIQRFLPEEKVKKNVVLEPRIYASLLKYSRKDQYLGAVPVRDEDSEDGSTIFIWDMKTQNLSCKLSLSPISISKAYMEYGCKKKQQFMEKIIRGLAWSYDDKVIFFHTNNTIFGWHTDQKKCVFFYKNGENDRSLKYLILARHHYFLAAINHEFLDHTHKDYLYVWRFACSKGWWKYNLFDTQISIFE